jgi:dihydroneopterin aldolase
MASLDAVTDFVSVKDLSVRAVIGVHAWERNVEQTLVVSVDMATDVRKAAASDDLADALDYSAVAATIAAVLREKFRLLEDMSATAGVPSMKASDRISSTPSVTSATSPTAIGRPARAVITIERTRGIS